jgi:hypothetical protein
MGALGGAAQNWLRAMEDLPVTIKVMRKPKAFKLRNQFLWFRKFATMRITELPLVV